MLYKYFLDHKFFVSRRNYYTMCLSSFNRAQWPESNNIRIVRVYVWLPIRVLRNIPDPTFVRDLCFRGRRDRRGLLVVIRDSELGFSNFTSFRVRCSEFWGLSDFKISEFGVSVLNRDREFGGEVRGQNLRGFDSHILRFRGSEFRGRTCAILLLSMAPIIL